MGDRQRANPITRAAWGSIAPNPPSRELRLRVTNAPEGSQYWEDPDAFKRGIYRAGALPTKAWVNDYLNTQYNATTPLHGAVVFQSPNSTAADDPPPQAGHTRHATIGTISC
jgi:hypothetical protein